MSLRYRGGVPRSRVHSFLNSDLLPCQAGWDHSRDELGAIKPISQGNRQDGVDDASDNRISRGDGEGVVQLGAQL